MCCVLVHFYKFCPQTIPQLILQIWYLFETGDWSEHEGLAPTIALAAAVFSGVQILATISVAHTQCILAKQHESVLFQFKVLGLGKEHRKYQTRTTDIAKDIANLLDVHQNVISIEKPMGFKFRVHLFLNDPDHEGAVYKDLLRDAVRDGTTWMEQWERSS